MLETTPVRSENNCGVLNPLEDEIKSAARRRVRKSRGEQANPRDNETASSNAFVAPMNNIDYRCERILTN